MLALNLCLKKFLLVFGLLRIFGGFFVLILMLYVFDWLLFYFLIPFKLSLKKGGRGGKHLM